MKTTVKIDNLKCGGCATSIEDALLEIQGVNKVIVHIDSDDVEVEHLDNCDVQTIKNTLRKLGYPEHGTVEGIEKVTSNVKSYVSCAVGKVHNKMKH